MGGDREVCPHGEEDLEGRLDVNELEFHRIASGLHTNSRLQRLELLGGGRLRSSCRAFCAEVVIAADDVGVKGLVVTGNVRVAGAKDRQREVLCGKRLPV